MEVLAIEGLVKFKAVMEPLQEFSNVRLCAIVPAFVDRRVKKSEDQLAEIRRLLEASPITLESANNCTDDYSDSGAPQKYFAKAIDSIS